jgi:hypothetical protein
MLGAVFGSEDGVSPGCNMTFSYRRFQAYDSSEYVFDMQNRADSYFYTWNQVTYSPRAWLQVGLAAQRTHVYSTGLSVQRGVLVGFTHKKMNFSTTVFDFGWTTPTEVISLGINF